MYFGEKGEQIFDSAVKFWNFKYYFCNLLIKYSK